MAPRASGYRSSAANPAIGALVDLEPELPVIGIEVGEDLPEVAISGDHGTEGGEKGESRHAELVGPGRPDARLVDEGLADVEADPACVGHVRLRACR